MRTPRIEVGKIRREQIIEAAVAVIAAEGLQNLSLSAIEKRTGMSRGQLTYYFSTKEDILLAVFDRLLLMMHQRANGDEGPDQPCQFPGTGWERMRRFLTLFLLDPPPAPEFHSLQYTFLSQIGHREDYRQRLASLYAEWRQHMGADVATELARSKRPASPKTLATLVQAILHGLAMQRAADPEAYDREEMLKLCLDLLGDYLRLQPSQTASLSSRAKKSISVNGAAQRSPVRGSSKKARVKHE